MAVTNSSANTGIVASKQDPHQTNNPPISMTLGKAHKNMTKHKENNSTVHRHSRKNSNF
jgi:hypothetical protein